MDSNYLVKFIFTNFLTTFQWVIPQRFAQFKSKDRSGKRNLITTRFFVLGSDAAGQRRPKFWITLRFSVTAL